MAPGAIALTSDEYEPPAWLPKVRQRLLVHQTRYAAIIVGDVAFILFLVDHFSSHYHPRSLLWALIPITATSVLCAYTLWRERKFKKKVMDASAHSIIIQPYFTLPFYVLSWLALLAWTILWHIRLTRGWYRASIRDTYCGMLMLLFLVFIIILILDSLLCLIERMDRRLAKRYHGRSKAPATSNSRLMRADADSDEEAASLIGPSGYRDRVSDNEAQEGA